MMKDLTKLNSLTVMVSMDIEKAKKSTDIITPWRKFAYREEGRVPDFK